MLCVKTCAADTRLWVIGTEIEFCLSVPHVASHSYSYRYALHVIAISQKNCNEESRHIAAVGTTASIFGVKT